jgi:tetratricopeptide (TPR) repeat protein
MFLDHRDYDAAFADFDKYIAQFGKSATVLGDRGLARIGKHDYANARADLDAAFALDTANPVVFRARGWLDQTLGDNSGAVAAFTMALTYDPGNPFALLHRAHVYSISGDDEHALADAADVEDRRPELIDAYVIRMNIFRHKAMQKQALEEADALIAANPASAYAYYAAGLAYSAFGKTDAAMQDFDRAVDLEPTDVYYLRRAQFRPKADIAEREADVDAALRHNGKSVDALAMRADIQYDKASYSDSIATLGTAISLEGNSFRLLVARGIAYAKANQPSLAEKDLTAARALAADPHALNELCWRQATAGVALAAALSACDEAVAKAPAVASYLDSRGMALLRLARYDDAIAAYSAALKLSPKSAYSLYGRGIAEHRKGDAKNASADISAALTANSQLAKEFASYGLAP